MRIVISGASGRMGRSLVSFLLDHPSFGELVGALDSSQSTDLGKDAGHFLGRQTGVLIQNDLSVLDQADCLIDFTRPQASIDYVKYCEKVACSMVIGTTGFHSEEFSVIQQAAQAIGIVQAPNMSVGVNAVMQLLSKAAMLFHDGYDCEIYEAHHRNKVDAPSGTALKMGEVVATAWNQELEDIADWSRHGHTGIRKTGQIGFSVVRGGDIVGDHRAMFCGQGEVIEISHRSSSRMSYAKGAFLAAQFLKDHTQGLFGMQEVIESFLK